MGDAAKCRPILFSGDMVRAILDGRKTQTRRPIKPQPGFSRWSGFVQNGCAYGLGMDYAEMVRNFARYQCPYGAPGDRLWVRETWGYSTTDSVIFRADDQSERAKRERWVSAPLWRPSIHMPRWASRLTLEVIDVRVERVQDITEDDARAEGVTPVAFCRAGVPDGNEHREAFEMAWKALYGDESWARNDWVWAVTFRRVP